jgi:superfamily II DNA or RNA helicase
LPIHITVDNVIRVSKQDLPQGFIDHVRTRFTHPNPKLAKLPFYLTIGLPRTYESFLITDTEVILPRGTGRYARDYLASMGLEVEVRDARFVSPNPISFRAAPGLAPRLHQQVALAAISRFEQGVVEAPCGAGKSVLGMFIIQHRGQPALILVHTKDLMSQWRSELMSKFILDDGIIGEIGDGKFELGPITVALIQSMLRLDHDQWRMVQQTFGTVITDECHHVPAPTFLDVINRIPSKYRIGVTATPRRKDELDFLLYEYIGPIRHVIRDKDLEDAGITIPVSVVAIFTDFYTDYSGVSDWSRMINELTQDKARNDLIVENVVNDVREGLFILVLTGRVEHCDYLQQRFEELNIPTRALYGAKSKDERELIKEECKAGVVSVLLGTTVADEGLDIPALNVCHLTCPSNNDNLIKQRIGRVKRVVPGKGTPIVYDYVDHQIGILSKHWKNRKAWYKRNNYPVITDYITPGQADQKFGGIIG